jgi:hypothetical protein
MPLVASRLDSTKRIPAEPKAWTVGSTDLTLSSSMHSTIVEARLRSSLLCFARAWKVRESDTISDSLAPVMEARSSAADRIVSRAELLL